MFYRSREISRHKKKENGGVVRTMNTMKKALGLGLALLLAMSVMTLPPLGASPAAAANEGQFVFFQVNGGTTATVNPGGQVTFTFSFLPHLFMNQGTVQIVDVPENSLTTFIGSIPDPFVWLDKAAETPCNGSITFSVANIAGSNFTVYAIFTMETDSGNYSFVSSVVQVNVSSTLGINKTTTATSVLKGNTFTYQIAVINTSGGAVNNVTVQDLLSSSLDYVAASVTPTVVGQALTWNLGTMQNNDIRAITLTVRPKTTAVAGTVVNNTAQVTATGMGANQSTSSNTLILEQSLSFTKAVNKTTAGPGDQLTYTISFTNPYSSVILYNVQLQDTIPAYTGYVTHSTNIGQATPIVSGSNIVYWNVGTLSPGQTVQGTLVVSVFSTVLYNTVVQNTATFVGYKNEGGYMVPVSVAPAVAPQVTVLPAPFTLSKTVSPSIVQPGQQVSFTISYTNNSSGTVSPIQNCQIIDTIDSRITNLAFSGVTPSQSGSTYTWSLGALAPGQTGSVSFIGTVASSVAAGTTIPNTAYIQGTSVAQVSSTCQILVGVPNNITLAKTVDKTNVLPGETVNYTIAYSNPSANPTLPSITVTDTLPPGLTFLGGTTGFTQTGTVLSWTIANLTPGQTGTVTLAALLDPAAIVGNTITNTAVATLSGMTPVNSVATFQVGSLAPSMLQLVKIATADSVKAGEYITYLITYNNNGNLLLPSVIIEEPIPANTTFLSGNPSPAVDTVNNKISWNVGDLPPGANGTLVAQFTVPNTVIDNTIIANVVTGKVSGFQNATTATVLVSVGPVFHRAYIKGYPDRTFLPEKPITRAEIATILTRILSLDTTMTANIGSDVPSNHWAFSYINAVVFSGVMNGYPDGTFGPERPITRAELATVMVRARGLFSLIVAPPTFPDIAGHWAAGNVEAASRAMFITGYPSGDFRPDQTITRAETVTLIDRSFGRGPLIGTGLTPLYADVPSVHWAFSWVAEAAMSHRGLHTSDGNETLVEVSTEPPL